MCQHHRKFSNRRHSRSGIYVNITGNFRIVITSPETFISYSHNRSEIYLNVTRKVQIVVISPEMFELFSQHRQDSIRSRITGYVRIVDASGLNRIFEHHRKGSNRSYNRSRICFNITRYFRIVDTAGPDFISTSPDIFESLTQQVLNLCGHHRKGSNFSYNRSRIYLNITGNVFES